MPKTESTWSVSTKQDGALLRMVAVRITSTEPTLRKRLADFISRWGIPGLVMAFAVLFGFAGLWALATLSGGSHVAENEGWLLAAIIPLSVVGILFCMLALLGLSPTTRPRDLTTRTFEAHRVHSRVGLQWFYPETVDTSRRSSRVSHRPVPEPLNTELAVLFRDAERGVNQS